MMPANYKILLVDDDPAMLRILARWLEKAGYSVRTAADGREALEAVESECPDFLIADWEMPHLNGFELCQQVRNMQLPHYVYIVILSAMTGEAEMIAGLNNGADDFLTKPIAENELLARMQSSSRVIELERELSLMAHTDFLTGLLTQRNFFECLEKEWHRSKRFQLPLSCVMMDLDFFKQINDVYGHPAGDSVLKFAAELLQDTSRLSDTICRYGGEEFCILLPETDERNAAIWAERARARLAALRIPTELKDMRVTGSFGVAECCDTTESAEELVKLADQALLCAKRTGRDRVVRYATINEDAGLKLYATDWHGEVFEDMLACDIMGPLGVCLQEVDTIDQATQFFLQFNISSTPVLGVDGELVGFLSEKDLMDATISPDRWQGSVSSMMRPNAICYEEDTPIRVIHEFLCRVSVRSVVITKAGKPSGIINRHSLLQRFRDWVADRNSPSQAPSRPVSPECSTIDMASVPTPHSPDSVTASLSVG